MTRHMLRRAFVLLLGTLALAGCTGGYGGSYFGQPVALTPSSQAYQGGASAPTAGSGQVAILLPLSGPHADLGQAMLQAAKLALDAPGAPALDVKDTGGTPDGAAAAARAAIASSDSLILGPLTSAETAAVAPVARAAGISVLAFTNDPAQAQPGVWVLGITPGQQVRRLVTAVQGDGKTRIAALLPNSGFGQAMATAAKYRPRSSLQGRPDIRCRHEPGRWARTQSRPRAICRISPIAGGRSTRRSAPPVPRGPRTDAARHRNSPVNRSRRRPSTPCYLGDTGEHLAEVAAVLPYYDIDASLVRILGLTLPANNGSGSGQIIGAWYAAPDSTARAPFEQADTAQ